jgi:ATP-dependent Zn protease
LLGDVTAGAGGSDTSDLAMANTLAFWTVARWGLGEVDQLKWLAGGPEQIVSTHPELAAEAYRMLDVANKRALALIRRRMTEVRAIAGALMKRRALAHEDIAALLARSQTRRKEPAVRRPHRRRA